MPMTISTRKSKTDAQQLNFSDVSRRKTLEEAAFEVLGSNLKNESDLHKRNKYTEDTKKIKINVGNNSSDIYCPEPIYLHRNFLIPTRSVNNDPCSLEPGIAEDQNIGSNNALNITSNVVQNCPSSDIKGKLSKRKKDKLSLSRTSAFVPINQDSHASHGTFSPEPPKDCYQHQYSLNNENMQVQDIIADRDPTLRHLEKENKIELQTGTLIANQSITTPDLNNVDCDILHVHTPYNVNSVYNESPISFGQDRVNIYSGDEKKWKSLKSKQLTECEVSKLF